MSLPQAIVHPSLFYSPYWSFNQTNMFFFMMNHSIQPPCFISLEYSHTSIKCMIFSLNILYPSPQEAWSEYPKLSSSQSSLPFFLLPLLNQSFRWMMVKVRWAHFERPTSPPTLASLSASCDITKYCCLESKYSPYISKYNPLLCIQSDPITHHVFVCPFPYLQYIGKIKIEAFVVFYFVS